MELFSKMFFLVAIMSGMLSSAITSYLYERYSIAWFVVSIILCIIFNITVYVVLEIMELNWLNNHKGLIVELPADTEYVLTNRQMLHAALVYRILPDGDVTIYKSRFSEQCVTIPITEFLIIKKNTIKNYKYCIDV